MTQYQVLWIGGGILVLIVLVLLGVGIYIWRSYTSKDKEHLEDEKLHRRPV